MSFRRLLFVFIALCVSARNRLDRPRLARAAACRCGGAGAGRTDRHARASRAGQPDRRPVRPAGESALAGLAGGRHRSPAMSSRARARIEDFVGAVVRSAISDGEPITEGTHRAPRRPRLHGRRSDAGLSRRHGAGDGEFGHRRLRLSWRPGRSVADHDRPRTSGKRQRHASETLLTDLRVLAVDQRADDQNKEVVVAKTATLEVTPKQAETIAVATELGNLSLEPAQPRAVRRQRAARAALQPHLGHRGDAHRPAPPGTETAAPAAPIKVSVVRGGKVEELEFARSGK